MLPAIITVRSRDVPEQISSSMTDVINAVPLGVRQCNLLSIVIKPMAIIIKPMVFTVQTLGIRRFGIQSRLSRVWCALAEC